MSTKRARTVGAVGARWLPGVVALTAVGVVSAGLVQRGRDRAYRRGVVNARIAQTMALGEAEAWQMMRTPEASALITRMEDMTRLGRTEHF